MKGKLGTFDFLIKKQFHKPIFNFFVVFNPVRLDITHGTTVYIKIYVVAIGMDLRGVSYSEN